MVVCCLSVPVNNQQSTIRKENVGKMKESHICIRSESLE